MPTHILFKALILACLLSAPAHAAKDFPPVTHEGYKKLCGDCHFPHQSVFMPLISWRYFLSKQGRTDHFGVKVPKKGADLNEIFKYLGEDTAENSKHKIIKRIYRGYDEKKIPLRITTNAHYERMHRKIFDDEKRFVIDNPKVIYQGDCVACHEDALKGDFSERTAKIPGFKKEDWD